VSETGFGRRCYYFPMDSPGAEIGRLIIVIIKPDPVQTIGKSAEDLPTGPFLGTRRANVGQDGLDGLDGILAARALSLHPETLFFQDGDSPTRRMRTTIKMADLRPATVFIRLARVHPEMVDFAQDRGGRVI
jgi:hypothetical protein